MCNSKVYIGGYETKNHGDGTWGSGTCPDCGDHKYTPTTPTEIHPHLTGLNCDCGHYTEFYFFSSSCSLCTANTKTAKNSASDTLTFFVLADADISVVPIGIVLDCTVEYYNTFSEPAKNSDADYGFPSFVSYQSALAATYVCTSTVEPPEIYPVAHDTVKYYNSSNELISTQTLISIAGPNAASNHNTYYSLPEKPACAVASAGYIVADVFIAPPDSTIDVITAFP